MTPQETTDLIAHWQQVKQRIAQAAEQVNRDPDSITLLAVSKMHPSEAIATLQQAGQIDFGENYVQELMQKTHDLASQSPAIRWHFIGPLQSNKAKEVAQHADWMHSCDRIKIAEQLNKYRADQATPLKICIQVNIDQEDRKSGVTSMDELIALARYIQTCDHLLLQGLMAIPAPTTDANAQAHAFAQLRQQRDELSQTLGMALPDLSMGMSADLESAIAQGATIVRIGTDIFGQRHYPH
jgi:pyridoxal phosphate enzyme (YggS family)